MLTTYRLKLEALRIGEEKRLAAFTQGDAYDDLRVNKAYQTIPLYDTLQQRGSSDKGGPYGFAKEVSDYYGRPGHRGQARFDAEGKYIKKLIGQFGAGLTKDEMSKIMVHTGRRSQSGAEHGLEKEMFTGNYKHYNFATQFTQELHNQNAHLESVLRKIYLEKRGASARPQAYSQPENWSRQPHR